MKYILRFLVVLSMAAVLLTVFSCKKDSGSSDPDPLSDAKTITAFSFTDPVATGVIDENAKTISVTVPYGSGVTVLIATFTATGTSVTVGATPQISGTTPNDFTGSAAYTVTAADGTTVDYTVTVTVALNSAKAITSFSFTSPTATGVIDENAKTISVTVPYLTNVSTLIATFTTTGASVAVGATQQVSDTTPNDFTSSVVYTVTGANGTTASYAVTVTIDNNTFFSNPEKVTVIDYNDSVGSGDLMEPFVSRDGQYLFFNDRGPSRNLFYATFVDEKTFQFQGAITSINTTSVDGVPTMDVANKFYYVSTANYIPPTTYDTLYTGIWTGTTVTGSTPVIGLAITTPGAVNFDVEVSWDGSTLYFNDGIFSGSTLPDEANIAIAVDSGSGFARDPNSETIMANVNTVNLEYAPAISAAGLEFFFTRFDLSTMDSALYRVTRPSVGSPFGVPQLVSAIDGQVEGPALSPDEKSLYYHRMNSGTGWFEIYRVTRP